MKFTSEPFLHNGKVITRTTEQPPHEYLVEDPTGGGFQKVRRMSDIEE